MYIYFVTPCRGLVLFIFFMNDTKKGGERIKLNIGMANMHRRPDRDGWVMMLLVGDAVI